MPSVCREQSDYHQTEIHEISHLGLMLIFVSTLKFQLQSHTPTKKRERGERERERKRERGREELHDKIYAHS